MYSTPVEGVPTGPIRVRHGRARIALERRSRSDLRCPGLVGEEQSSHCAAVMSQRGRCEKSGESCGWSSPIPKKSWTYCWALCGPRSGPGMGYRRLSSEGRQVDAGCRAQKLAHLGLLEHVVAAEHLVRAFPREHDLVSSWLGAPTPTRSLMGVGAVRRTGDFPSAAPCRRKLIGDVGARAQDAARGPRPGASIINRWNGWSRPAGPCRRTRSRTSAACRAPRG